MSTDEKGNEVSADTGDQDPITPSSGNDATSQADENGLTGPIILFFIVGLIASLIVGWVIFPQLLYSQKRQPVGFNHALHNEEVDNECESCHFFREDGTYSGVPKLAQCIECHEEVQGEDPGEAKFVNEYVAKGREVPWLIYSRQPDNVFFSHVAHVKMAQMECVACHGNIGESESLKVYEENRISGYSRDIWGKNIAGFKRNSWDRMKMDDCSECHVKENINQNSVQTLKGGCFVCHK
ncbi:MAG: cytochrome c3 family protein [Desulfobacterales bacterium]|nr:cytochrome c3 family protein [Desulfobacterales bacterium]